VVLADVITYENSCNITIRLYPDVRGCYLDFPLLDRPAFSNLLPPVRLISSWGCFGAEPHSRFSHVIPIFAGSTPSRPITAEMQRSEMVIEQNHHLDRYFGPDDFDSAFKVTGCRWRLRRRNAQARQTTP
jgi:hypothetical protein